MLTPKHAMHSQWHLFSRLVTQGYALIHRCCLLMKAVSFFSIVSCVLWVLVAASAYVACVVPSMSLAYASEQRFEYDRQGKIKGCAWYRRYNGSWSKHYKVRGEIKSGRQLIFELSNDRINPNTMYFYIRWKNGGYSAIDIGPEGRPFVDDRILKDQKGKTWVLTNGWDFCSNH